MGNVYTQRGFQIERLRLSYRAGRLLNQLNAPWRMEMAREYNIEKLKSSL